MEAHGGSSKVPWFGDFGPAALFLCIFSAVYGLSISVILKRFGSLTRTFISTVAIVLNALLDAAFFGESLSTLEVTTFLTIFAAIFLFTILGDEWEKDGPGRAGKAEAAPRKAFMAQQPSDAEEEGATLLTSASGPGGKAT